MLWIAATSRASHREAAIQVVVGKPIGSPRASLLDRWACPPTTSASTGFLIEAENKKVFSRGMRALAICAARAINEVLGRKGKVFAYRYHATSITTPRQMRNALAYVLNNWRRHNEDQKSPAARTATLDPYSTAIHFRGWKEAPKFAVPNGYEPLPSAEATTWLLRVGWQRHGLISAFDVPGSAL